MVLEVQKKLNIPASGSVLVSKAQDSTAVVTVPVGQEVTSETSGTSFNAKAETKTEGQNTSKRNKQQLLDSLKFLQQYGITQDEGIEILCAMGFNCNEQTLLNLEQKELNKQIKIMSDTIVALNEDGIEINKENLKIHASKYASQINCGWDSVKSFRDRNKANSDSLLERLKNAFGKDYSNATDEELINAVKQYCLEISNTDITDFSKLLYNSSDKEIEILYKAIPYFSTDERLSGIVAAIKSCSSKEAQSRIVSDYETNKSIMTTIDKDGNSMSKEDMEKMSAGLASYRTFEDATEYTEKTIQDTKAFLEKEDIQEKIKQILAKLDNNEKLTEEEQKLLNEYNQILAEPTGQFIGYSNSDVLSKTEKVAVTTDLNDKLYETAIYRGVLQNVVNYSNEHPESLSISKDEFDKLMDLVTSGNYTIVTNDNLNNTTTELIKPFSITDTNEVTSNPSLSQGGFGYNSRELAGVNPESRVAELYMTKSIEQTPVMPATIDDIENNTEVKSSKNILNVAKGHIAEFYSYISDNGVYKTVAEVYKNFSDIRNQVVISTAKKFYSMLTPDFQERILRNVTSSDAFSELLKVTNDEVVLNIKGNFSNSYKNQLLEKTQEKVKEHSI